MKTPRIRTRDPKTETIIMTGGLNQSVSNLELSPGELFDGLNYEEIDGTHFGYRSTDGYERGDGEYLASGVPLILDAIADPPTFDDTAREVERDSVTSIPGGVEPLGVFVYRDEKYVLVNDTTLKLYKATTSGWTENASFTALAVPVAGITKCHIKIARFTLDGLAGTMAIICTGTTLPIFLRVATATYLTEPNGVGDTPVLGGFTGFPSFSDYFNERLFLAYPLGNLVFSGTGTPDAYDPAVYLGGVYYLEDEITDMITVPNTLAAFCEDSIHIISKTDLNMLTGIDMAKEVFNDQEGAYRGTAQKIMGRIIYASRQGLTTLDTTASFGDFEQMAISKNVQKTFDAKKNIIVGSSIIRDKSQYRLYYSDGTALAITFDVEKNVKGAGILKYPHAIKQIVEDNDNVAYFISTDTGLDSLSVDKYWMYKRSEQASSFDGAEIPTIFKTAYYPYKAAVNYKHFMRILTEVDAPPGLTIFVRPSFEYATANSAKQQNFTAGVNGGLWNSGYIYGPLTPAVTFWGAGGIVQRFYTYITGTATNMSLFYSSQSKYHQPHTIHNAIVSFKMGAQKV